MGWKEPGSPWARAMLRRVRSLLVALVFLAGLMLLHLGMCVFILFRDSPFEGPLLGDVVILAVPAVFVLVSGVALARLRRRERRLAQLIPTHDGLVCPHCLGVLPSDRKRGACPGCGRHYCRRATQRYWEWYGLASANARVWLVRHGGGNFIDRLWLRGKRRGQQHGWRTGLWAAALLPLAVLLVACSAWGGLYTVIRLGSVVGLGLIGGGVGALIGSTSLARRRGLSRHCAKCGYQQAPRAEATECCPECGSRWREAGATITGKPAANKRMRVIGVVLVAFGALLGMMGLDRFAWMLPTSTLLASAGGSASSQAVTAWMALKGRALSPREQRALAEALLGQREKRELLCGDAEAWLINGARSGTLPEDLVDRFYGSLFRAWIVAPSGVRRGEAFEVQVACEEDTTAFSVLALLGTVYVEGFYVGGAAAPLGQRSEVDYAPALSRGCSPRATLTAESAGELRVRFAYWLVLDNAGRPARTIVWQADGTPVIPSTAVWWKRFEVEHWVEVQ